MKNLSSILLLCCIFIFGYQLFAQTVPLANRNVSGVLRDSLNKPISNATVSLVSAKDTLQTSTNSFGFWGFKDVKKADFTLTVRALGYHAYIRKYFNNDTNPQLNIPQIRLGVKEEQLETVTITRLKGPVVKGDTTEFWAKDYIVRDYARLEDLLKRMEGISIDAEGSVFYNGEKVVKALFNNAQYFSGSVKEAMKELPADIVERIQIIDKNIDGTSNKMLKSEQTAKVMNIVTKADKSAGRIYNVSLTGGTQARSEVNTSIRKIDGVDQISGNFSYKKEPLGIKQNPVPGSIGGQMPNFRASGNATVSEGTLKEIQGGLSKNIKIKDFNLSPQYNFTQNNQITSLQTLSENFYNEGTLGKNNVRNQKIISKNHSLSTFFNKPLKNNASFNGSFDLKYSDYKRNSESNNIQYGIINNLEKEAAYQKGRNFDYGFNATYNKAFNPKLNLNISLNSSLSNANATEDSNLDIYANGNQQVLPDSNINQLRNTKNHTFSNFINNSITWTKNKNLKLRTTLGLRSQYTLRDIEAYLFKNEKPTFQQDLSNYQAVNTFAVPFTITSEYTFDNGFYISPVLGLRSQWLAGTLNLKTTTISRQDLFVEPSLTMGYTYKEMGRLQLTVGQLFQQPNIVQLNPDNFYRTPFDVQIGNANLKNTQSTRYSISYNNFFAKSRFNVALNTSFGFIDNGVTTNRFLEIDPVKNIIKTTNSFENINGARNQSYRVDLSKTLTKISSTISLNGVITASSNPYLANGKIEQRNSLMQDYKLSFFYSPFKWLDLGPDFNYNATQDKNTLSSYFGKTYNRVFLSNLKTSFYLAQNWTVNANFSQALYSTTNIMTAVSPFVLNANIEKRIFKNKNGIISFVVMDLARQNAQTSYASNDLGYTNTVTNTDSRYFLFQFSWRPQAWGKSKFDTGQGRRGDGSFIKR